MKQTASARIMVVGDDTEQAVWLRSVLEEVGYQVEIFAEFSAFRAALQSQGPPAAVIVDMIFPEGDDAGALVIAEMKVHATQAVPVIFFSARQDMAARLAAHRAGATRYLIKPVDREVLLRAIVNSAALTPMRPYRVLVVDDSKSQLAAHVHMLRAAGMEVREADNPLHVLDILADFSAEALLLDIYMPQCSGQELAAILRDDQRYAEIPIIYLSTETSVSRQLQALDSGGEHFLVKPADPVHLAWVVSMHARQFRRSMEQAEDLRASRYAQERKQQALDAHAIVSMADVSGNIIYVNDKFCTISGYTRAELLGNNHRIVKSDKHSSEFYADMWHTISSGKIWHGELCNRAKDGSLYWVESSIVPFLDADGLPYQYISIRTDVTLIKKSETMQQAALNLLRNIANRVPGVVFQFRLRPDGSSCFPYASEAARELFRVSPEEIREDASKVFAICHPDDFAALMESIRLSAQNLTPWHHEVRTKFDDGTVRWLSGNALPQREADGSVLWHGFISDATERKQIELALQDAKSAAESASHAKSEFLASMSHELRTPLNAILGFSQLLGMDAEAHQETRDHAQEIERAGQHLLALVNDMIDLARIEAGKLELSLEPVQVGPVLKESLAMMESIARQNGIRLLEKECENWQVTVHADHVRLRQALFNLLSNAIKYNRPDGSVCLACSIHADRLRMSVTDTGPGIPLDKQARIFNAFDRLGEERGDVEGTGIGLIITKRIVEAMGGSVGFDSTPGQGSHFWLEFPLSTEVAVHHAAPKVTLSAVPGSVQATRPMVLCIEDNPMNLRLMQQIFAGRKNLELRSADTAEMGIELAQTRAPALILMDINLPGMDGYAALAVLRADVRTAHIPVIAITANAMKGDQERGLEAGFCDYLAKPLDVVRLLAILDEMFKAPGS